MTFHDAAMATITKLRRPDWHSDTHLLIEVYTDDTYAPWGLIVAPGIETNVLLLTLPRDGWEAAP